MNYYICDCCGEVYTTRQEFCPKASCSDGMLIEVDELMLPIVQQLQAKGYYIDSVCSGHAYDQATFPGVYFDQSWTDDYSDEQLEEMFDDLPELWELLICEHEFSEIGRKARHVSLVCMEDNDTEETEGYYHSTKSPEEYYYTILEANLSLLDFVKKLEPREED